MAVARRVRDVDGYPEYLHDGDDFDRFLFGHDALAAWVAASDGHVVGHVALHPRTTREAMALAATGLGRSESDLLAVARLLVDPAHRRKGIARSLLDAATAQAAVVGRAPIIDVAVHYTPAIELYEASGWVRIGEVAMQLPNGEPFREYVYVTD